MVAASDPLPSADELEPYFRPGDGQAFRAFVHIVHSDIKLHRVPVHAITGIRVTRGDANQLLLHMNNDQGDVPFCVRIWFHDPVREWADNEVFWMTANWVRAVSVVQRNAHVRFSIDGLDGLDGFQPMDELVVAAYEIMIVHPH